MIQLSEAAAKIGFALEEAGIPYRVEGPLASCLHAIHTGGGGGATNHADIAYHCNQTPLVAKILKRLDLQYKTVPGGFDIVLEGNASDHGGTIRMFHGDASAVANSTILPCGLKIVPFNDVVRANLEQATPEDTLYVKYFDCSGLITSEVEESLSAPLRAKLEKIRAEPTPD